MKIAPSQPPFVPTPWIPLQSEPNYMHPAVAQARSHHEGALHALFAYDEKTALQQTRHDLPIDYFEHQSFSGYGLIEGDNAVLSFRGTQVKNWDNWKADLKLWPCGTPGRHLGFLRGWEALSNDVHQWLDSHRPTKLSLYGHSLGGAIAILAALELAKKWDIGQVVVFGCPRVGGPSFSRLYAETQTGSNRKTKLEDVTFRYMLGTDFFARIPPPVYFRHVGKPLYLTEEGNFISYPMPLLARMVNTYNSGASSADEPSLTSIEGTLAFR